MNCSIAIAVFPVGGADRAAADSSLKPLTPNIGSKSRQSHALIAAERQNFVGKSIASRRHRTSKTFHRWREK
jgi:hypothetical protein